MPRRIVLALVALVAIGLPAHAADSEFTGTFEPRLVADRDGRMEESAFTPAPDRSRLKLSEPIDAAAHVTSGMLYDPRTEKASLLAVLVEPKDELPVLLVDANGDGALGDAERFELERTPEGYSNVFVGTIEVALAGGSFPTLPLAVEAWRGVRADVLGPNDRLVQVSKAAFARGTVTINGRKTLVQYAFNPRSKKVTPSSGTLGVDSDGDGAIDPDAFSAESADAHDRAVVFRAGDAFVSTKKADVEKNQIVMRSHSASDYKRIELRVGSTMPDFEFTDFDGTKRRFAEFNGKYVLLDFWASWCPPCRAEMPHLREAYLRYREQGFEILALNADEPEMVPGVKDSLKKFGAGWTQARRESILGLMERLGVDSYPTTLLVGPDGKVVSLNNPAKGQLALRGAELVRSVGSLVAR